MLTEEERAVLQNRLREAEQAWHELNLGQSARTFVDQNGERVEYTPANRLGLRAYILELRQQLGMKLNVSGPAGLRIF